jgi:limonene-1,2-epoxide hydrolase
MLTPDAIYQNGPARPVKGREDIATLFRKMTRGLTSCNFEILHLATSGHVVFTERLDVVTVGDVTAELPVAGVFEVRDGLISEWREYFDLAMHMRALSPQQNGESSESEDAL